MQDELTTEKLTEAFDFLKDPSAKKAAQEIAGKIATEDGVAAGVEVGGCMWAFLCGHNSCNSLLVNCPYLFVESSISCPCLS